MHTAKATSSRFTKTPNSSWLWFIGILLAIVIFAAFDPAEHSLDANVSM